MVRHTLTSLGPKVLAGRMVQDYVQKLYEPAARSLRAASAEDFAGSRELAAWTTRVRRLWPQVMIEHVDAEAESDAEGEGVRRPRLGGGLRIRALVQIGELAPDEVQVQAVFGRVDEDDQLRSTAIATLEHLGVDEIGRNRYEGVIHLEQSGPFGYTVRAVPTHRMLSSSAELGLATLPYSG
jgi:starch phosphorylase